MSDYASRNEQIVDEFLEERDFMLGLLNDTDEESFDANMALYVESRQVRDLGPAILEAENDELTEEYMKLIGYSLSIRVVSRYGWPSEDHDSMAYLGFAKSIIEREKVLAEELAIALG